MEGRFHFVHRKISQQLDRQRCLFCLARMMLFEAPQQSLQAVPLELPGLLKKRERNICIIMNLNLRVSLDFAGYSDSDLDTFAANVIVCLTGNPAFPAPPVTLPVFTSNWTAFHDAILAAALGGLQLTAAKNAAREALLDALRKLAAYVQSVDNHNLDVLLTSGFYANSTNRAQSPLDPPLILSVTNLMTTKVLVRLEPVINAKSYNVQTTVNGTTAWTDAGIFTQARRIEVGNLVPATTYAIRARAIGGNTGSSDWSNPMSIMAT
jgi:hypothetical protein